MQIAPAAVAGTTAVVFVSLFILERFLPLRAATSSLFQRLLINAIVSGFALAFAVLVVRPFALSALGTGKGDFGLLGLASMPTLLKGLCGFLLMDLSFYYWHLANHRVPLLWRFHNVHHIDPDLDVSTAFRFHVGEIAFSAAFRVVQITLIGVSTMTYLIYEGAFQAGTVFHHSNVRLPIRLERWLCRVLVTPRMHGIHHSQLERETNSNYATVFSWWDWLHRTLQLNVPQAAIRIGVPGYSRPEDNRFWTVLTLPFQAQRPYWRSSDDRDFAGAQRAYNDRRTRLAE